MDYQEELCIFVMKNVGLHVPAAFVQEMEQIGPKVFFIQNMVQLPMSENGKLDSRLRSIKDFCITRRLNNDTAKKTHKADVQDAAESRGRNPKGRRAAA